MSLSNQAYELIKHKIVSLELAPGIIIDEPALREEFGLGRTPIREALQRLSREQLVNIMPRRGMFVTEINLPDLNRLFEIRVPLEALAAQLAAQRGTDQQWNDMEALLSGSRDQQSNASLIATDLQCHEIIYQAANNPILHETLSMLYALSLRLWHYALADVRDMEAAIVEHQAILVALRSGDEAAATQLMETHIRGFQHEIQEAILWPSVPNN